jgi:hypothetical protein
MPTRSSPTSSAPKSSRSSRGPGDIVGYRFPRMVHYLGKWIRHGEWYPDIKLRLFRKDRGHSEGQEPHDRVTVDGPVKPSAPPSTTSPTTTSPTTSHTLNRFSSISANEKFSRGELFLWRDLFFRPPWRFSNPISSSAASSMAARASSSPSCPPSASS